MCLSVTAFYLTKISSETHASVVNLGNLEVIRVVFKHKSYFWW